MGLCEHFLMDRLTAAEYVIVAAEGAPSQADGSRTFSITTWNIRCGRDGGLESALRALESLGVDIAMLTEAKLTGGIYTRDSRRDSMVATDAKSAWQGDIAVCVRENSQYEVEEIVKFRPNVVTIQLQTGASVSTLLAHTCRPPTAHQLIIFGMHGSSAQDEAHRSSLAISTSISTTPGTRGVKKYQRSAVSWD